MRHVFLSSEEIIQILSMDSMMLSFLVFSCVCSFFGDEIFELEHALRIFRNGQTFPRVRNGCEGRNGHSGLM